MIDNLYCAELMFNSLPQKFASGRCIHIAPFRATFECFASGGNSNIHISLISFGNRSQLFTRCRIDGGECFARLCVDKLIVDENLSTQKSSDKSLRL